MIRVRVRTRCTLSATGSLRIVIESRGSSGTKENQGYAATINLVDLAGSECANYLLKDNRSGRMETSCINKVVLVPT